MTREIPLPLDLDPCGCGSETVAETADGTTCRYECLGCGDLVADIARKSTP